MNYYLFCQTFLQCELLNVCKVILTTAIVNFVVSCQLFSPQTICQLASPFQQMWPKVKKGWWRQDILPTQFQLNGINEFCCTSTFSPCKHLSVSANVGKSVMIAFSFKSHNCHQKMFLAETLFSVRARVISDDCIFIPDHNCHQQILM